VKSLEGANVKRLIPLGVCVLVIILFSAAPAAAQGTGGFQFGLSGGASFPTGDSSDAFDTGYNGGIVLNYELPALPLGIRVDGDYRNFSGKSVGSASGSAEIFDGNANLVVGIRILLVKVYALGGGGFYNMKFKAENAGISSSISQTDFGWNAGAGVAFVVGKLSIFGEGRYHEVTLDNSAGKFKFVAATAGILF
jgi:opacity protein-like surface antigen